MAERFATRVRCISYDHAGTGRSSKRAMPFTTGQMAAGALRVLDEEGIESAYMVGLSLGGAVAQELALRHPGRVRGLILMSTSATGAFNLHNPLALTAVSARVLGGSLRRRRLVAGPMVFSPAFLTGSPGRADELLAPLTAHLAAPWSLAGQYSAAALHDRRRQLHRIRTPTLVLHGDRDVLVPVRSARRLAAGIPGAELHIFPGAGHGFMFERLEETFAVVTDWLDRR
jgi:3-oxoadipate enol-lactonase